jgi:hypothetical protein
LQWPDVSYSFSKFIICLVHFISYKQICCHVKDGWWVEYEIWHFYSKSIWLIHDIVTIRTAMLEITANPQNNHIPTSNINKKCKDQRRIGRMKWNLITWWITFFSIFKIRLSLIDKHLFL